LLFIKSLVNYGSEGYDDRPCLDNEDYNNDKPSLDNEDYEGDNEKPSLDNEDYEGDNDKPTLDNEDYDDENDKTNIETESDCSKMGEISPYISEENDELTEDDTNISDGKV
jgi:hypothetical protein